MEPDQKINILLVDDRPENLISLEVILADPTLNLVRANSGREALRHVLNTDFALIMLDVQMPTLNGFETAKLIRGRERSRDTPIIFMTAYASQSDEVSQGYAIGAVDFTFKPFAPEILKYKVAVFVDLFKKTQALRQMNETLEQRVAERTAELQRMQEQLFEAQKMESVGTLAGGVAHDFNNLLTVILGNTQFIQIGLPSDDPTQAKLVPIAAAAERAAALTQQLLAFGRRQRLERRALDLNQLLDHFMQMLDRIIGEDIEVNFRPAASLPLVLADRTQLEQVVLNLAVNARDAMPKGGRLLIETQAVEVDEFYQRRHAWAEPGHYVQLIMSDTGCGMDAETQQRVFEPFFTTKEVGKGTGLGLAVVYGIVKQHDGLIDFYSEVGQGTAFKIYLPVTEQPAQITVKPVEPQARSGTETILLAEDEEILREFAQIILTDLGYKVLPVLDGQEALDMFTAQSDQIDLVILDVVMPRLGGLEAYERIHELNSAIPVILMTGYSAEIAQDKLKNNNDLQVIQKPYNINVLGRRVREALDSVK